MSYFINYSPRSPQAAFPPSLREERGKVSQLADDGVSQDISRMKVRHYFFLLT